MPFDARARTPTMARRILDFQLRTPAFRAARNQSGYFAEEQLVENGIAERVDLLGTST